MLKTLKHLFLVVCILWQSSWVSSHELALTESNESISHMAEMHWVFEAHHHDHDGQVHQDVSTQSIEHLTVDDSVNSFSAVCSEHSFLPKLHIKHSWVMEIKSDINSQTYPPLGKPPRFS